MGHLSRNCPNKKKDTPSSTQNSKTTAQMIELEEQEKNGQKQNPKEAMAEQIKAMSAEERNVLLDNLVLQGF